MSATTRIVATSAREVDRRPVDRLAAAVVHRRRGGRLTRTLRRIVAVALFLLAGVLALTPPPRASAAREVWAAARSLPVGTMLTPSDLVALPASGPPEGAFFTTADIAGRVLAAPIRRGEIITDARLIGPDGPDPGPGRVAVPIRPADAGTADLLSPGAHVGVVGVGSDGAVRSLTDDAIVLSVRAPPPGGLSSPGSAGGPLVVLAVRSVDADALIAMALTGAIGLRFT